MARPVVIIAALSMLLVVAACGGSSASTPPVEQTPATDTPAASVSASPPAAPTSSDSLPPLTPFGPDLATQLHAIRDKVSEIRGLPVGSIAQEGVATAADLHQYNVDQFAELEPDDTDTANASLTAMHYLGLAPEDYTLANFAGDFSDDIAGFYDFRHKALVLVGDPNKQLSKLDQLVLAHEYTHSLQDKTFDLEALEKQWADNPLDKSGRSSYGETVKCLIEGDATFTEIKYAEEMFGPDWRTAIQDASASPAAESALPPFIQHAVQFDYNDCEVFVSNLYDEGGWAAVNAAFRKPPATTEQIINIRKYSAGEFANSHMPADLTKSDLSGWTKHDIGQFGMYDIYNYIVTLTDDPLSAYTAADGWGSGWLRTYDQGSDPGIAQAYLSFDSEADLTDFLAAFSKIKSYNADVSDLAPGDATEFAIGERFASISVATDAPAIELLVAPSKALLTKASPHLVATPTPAP
ncbi:MAG: hypothetical protein ABI559_08420 [Chloroflexota bacterium]